MPLLWTHREKMPSKRILLVDDEPSIRLVLSAVLQSHGFTVDLAEDGFAALRAMRSAVPDLLVTDLRMPNMNGFELLATVREKYPTMPALAISGEFVGEQVEGILADAFLQKGSYTPEQMLHTIDRLLAGTLRERRTATSAVWAPTGNAAAMVTCSQCLKSFPLDPCDTQGQMPNEITCIFCEATLQYRLVAITKSA